MTATHLKRVGQQEAEKPVVQIKKQLEELFVTN